MSQLEQVKQAVEQACRTIAPTWPLDQMIAVNPYWGRIQHSFEEVAAQLERSGASPFYMNASYYLKRWERGDINGDALGRALAEKPSRVANIDDAVQELVGVAQASENGSLKALPLLSDSHDKRRDLGRAPAWRDTITHQIAQFCAAYFDQHQAAWHPQQHHALYTSWLEEVRHDKSVRLLMRSDDVMARAQSFADDALSQIQRVLEQLQVAPEHWALWLETVLMQVSGWASWCSYRRWQAQLQGKDDQTLVELLAVRASWELLVDDERRDSTSVWQRWQRAWQKPTRHYAQRDLLLLWQRAHECSFQQKFAATLQESPQPSAAPKVRAYFCIDVRSEVFRRHFEAQSSAILTGGFAGFFGLPISYTPLGTHAGRPQLPGLLAPALHITDSCGNAEQDQACAVTRQRTLQQKASWRPFKTLPASSFSLVETLGLGYASKLLKRSWYRAAKVPEHFGLAAKQVAQLRPTLPVTNENFAERAALAAGVLQGMSLTRDFGELVMLVGHGAMSQNNPQQAGLDCGACCGQTGEVNARALAQLLNRDDIRAALANQGIVIPPSTWFMAALHNTTTDEIAWFDTELIPPAQAQLVAQTQAWLAAAGESARQERAPSLGLSQTTGRKLLPTLQARAQDWSQTRPEWALANNAAFVVAPRERTRGLNLGGRSFLHDYHANADDDGSVLTQIMTAPMVVTHWINMQYFASTVDNLRFGSGNKTLHNVVGGRIGVFEGNGGDLRIGLAWQSIHDGEQYMHEPLRLSVYIAAPQQRIADIIAAHEVLQHLVHHEWLYVFQLNAPGEALARYHQGEWHAL